MKFGLATLFTLSIYGCVAGSVCHAQPGQNLALGKTVTLQPRPSYDLCTDADDDRQLTDGEYVDPKESVWRQKGTVGWSNAMPAIITIDLGSVQPISGISYSTAAGSADVAWPTSLFLAVSDDKRTWHNAGDLVLLSRKNGVHKADGYESFRYITHDLRTKGRYISLHVVAFPYIFADEVEVYRGDDAWLQQPAPGEIIPDIAHLVTKGTTVASSAQRRIYDDIDTIRAASLGTQMPPRKAAAFNAHLDRSIEALYKIQSLDTSFKTIVPINDLHRDVLASYGELLAVQGYKPLTVWKKHRYDWLPLLAKPDKASSPRLAFSMLKNQFRSDSVLLTNSTGKPMSLKLKLVGSPRGAAPGWLEVNSVAWTDTTQGQPVADALLPLQAQSDGSYAVDVPAGVTRKVWFLVDSSKLAAGAFNGSVTVSGAGQPVKVPLQVKVSKIAMPRPRMSLYLWDFSNGKGASYAMTSRNKDSAVARMRANFVDTPWATRTALPWPSADSFDADGNLTAALDFSELDEWIARWPDARQFFVYAMIDTAPNLADFAGAKPGTPEFEKRIGSWARAISRHMTELKLKPQQLGICIGDEPHDNAEDQLIAAWAKAIKAGASELTIFQNPTWVRPDQAKFQEAITVSDVLCPNLTIFKEGGQPVQAYYDKLRGEGKKVWTYLASGPTRLYDPQRYYRHAAWHAFEMGATGEGFWSFSDAGGAPTSWNEYSGQVNYAAVFFDTDTVYSSVHWESIREGLEDYEELAMLRDAIEASNNATLKAEAQKLLDAAVKAVTINEQNSIDWNKSFKPATVDEYLLKVRAMLEKLQR